MIVDTMNRELMRKKWNDDYAQLTKEREVFRKYFDKNRKCRCKIESCRHYKKCEKVLEFQHNAWNLHIRHMNMGLRTLMTIIPKAFNKIQTR